MLTGRGYMGTVSSLGYLEGEDLGVQQHEVSLTRNGAVVRIHTFEI